VELRRDDPSEETVKRLRAALYARVSTTDQDATNQLLELRRYAAARGWEVSEYVDEGVSGTKDRRHDLDRLVSDARRRRLDLVVCWRLDRLGRNLKHLISLLDDFQAWGVAFVSLNEGIDATTAAGRLQMAVLAAIAEFERARIVERVRAGLARAKAEGKRLGRQPYDIPDEKFQAVANLSLREAGKQLGVSRTVIHRWRLSHKPSSLASPFASESAEKVGAIS
jgi:DNA invertase Pin-like site-specific DNA recombinase